jgi:hypothetical protein
MNRILCYAWLVFTFNPGPTSGLHTAAAEQDGAALCNRGGQYCINRATSSGWCKVQEATEAQMFGPNLAGPYNSRADATQSMCKNYYEPASSDPNRCGDVLPKGVCDNVK